MATLLGLALVLFYGLLVAYGRIMAGAHYLTDCVFAAGLAFLLGACIMRWTFAWSERASSTNERT
jgi:membrane-associated phospholipid phosphatase